MNVYKKRELPGELLILENLVSRSQVDTKSLQHYRSLRSGFDGEEQFDSLMENLDVEAYQLNDLLLKHNETYFQVDSLLITQEKIYVYEIKNYQGEYLFQEDQFFKLPKRDVINPLHQLGRMTTLLTQLLRTHGFNLPIEANIVFIHPEFTLFNAPLNTSIILPTQLPSHLRILNDLPSRLKTIHKRLADKLLELLIDHSPFKRMPEYTYEELQKGVRCERCGRISVTIIRKYYVCSACSHKGLTEKAILRSINELLVLFPNSKITTSLVADWCSLSIDSARGVLKRNFVKYGSNKDRFYKKERISSVEHSTD